MNIEAAASFIQAERILRLETSLGPDMLLPERMKMREGINRLFELVITVRSKRTDLTAEELVGKLADVSLETGEGQRRTWSGLTVELVEGPPVTRGLRSYQLTLVPQLWLMSQRSDCRIWQDKTSVEVAQILCSEHGLPAPDVSGIIDPPKPFIYSVQWNETDLAYLTRRLEADGIFFWFEHSGGSAGSVSGKHQLHIASYQSGYTTGSDSDIRFAAGSTDRNHINRFEKRFRFVPGKRSSADWNFLTPSAVPQADMPGLVKLPGNDVYDLYEYPAIGGYGIGGASEGIDATLVEAQSKLRMQAAEADHERIEGASSVRTLAPGRRFRPYDVANPGNSFDEHVIYEILHTARDNSYETNEGGLEYSNEFIALPSRVAATPHRTTPRPRIDGTQIAIIAGPKGEEIHTDKHARVKVWFPWDRRAKKDGSDTCWIRVMQSWGGPNYGGQTVPRIHMEAIVTYLDGDPDRPVIQGLVPNPNQYTPYKLPDHKTKSVIRSNSHKSVGFNELSFEDQTGRENMFLHAQKDQTIKVLNNQTSRVDQNTMSSVGANKSLEVGSNMSQQVGGGMNLVVGGVGGVANAIAGGVLAALSGNSAGLLQQAMSVAAAAAADKPSGGDKSADAAGEAVGNGSGAGVDAGDAGQGFAAIQSGLMAAGALGAMLPGMDKVRGGVNDAQAGDMRSDGGKSMNEAGAGLAQQVGQMVGKGILNELISNMQNTSVGVAQTEQVGVAKVVTVGQVYNQTVGNTKRVMIGKELFVGVGGGKDENGEEQPPKSILIMKDDGTILLKGVRIYVEAESHIQLIAPMVDNN